MLRWVSIKMLLLSAAFILLSLPSFAAQLSYACAYYQPPAAGATRIPRSTQPPGAHYVTTPDPTGGGGPISGQYGVTLNNTSGATGNGCMNPYNNVTYSLVSATIAGGLQGLTQAFASLPSSVLVWVGSSNIVVTYTYLPVSGPGEPCNSSPCPTEATIDEMSDSGGLLDDLFVEVFSPKNMLSPTLTQSGNYFGLVDTTLQPVNIEADLNPQNPSSGISTGTIFDRWVSGQGAAMAQGARTLSLDPQQSGYYLAYYSGACPSNYHFEASSNLSECVPNNCTASQNWDSATNACVTCGTGQYWNVAANQCVVTGCPRGEVCGHYTCPQACGSAGCIVVPPGVPPNNKPGDTTPIYHCKNANGGIGEPIQ
jgi:hypothetical protein